MAEQNICLMNMNTAHYEEGADAVATNKDEQITDAVHENGYESECSSSTRSDEDVARSALEIEADTFTRFIERQRVEVMFELRNLRMGERPVTGQPNRERIQTFINTMQEQQQQRSLPRIPSVRPAAPSAHIDDIDALANRRCVSAALGSAAFRQDLENAIRRTVETRPAPSLQVAIPQPASSLQLAIPQAPPVPRTFTPINNEEQVPAIVPVPIATIIREDLLSQTRQAPRYEPFNLERQERELVSWQTITQLQRETIVLEISDLVHRQLVSSALESDFRTHLEHNILTRFSQGAPNQQAEQQQQQAPVIAPPRVQPRHFPIQTTTTNTRASPSNIDDLSTRIDTMQRMLQLMFSMQMDMQRSLRQEVSSAIANNSLNPVISSSQPVNAGHCTVCLTAMADTVLYRCGHLCVCYMCGLNLRETTSATGVKCPICRAPVDDILRIYRSSRDGE